jgi:poly-beta-1,6-N-acetyl-D-glucosamine N-deacetylase
MVIIACILFFISIFLYFKGKGVPVFLYHQVNELSNIDKHLLEKHFKYLKASNFKTFTITEAREEISKKGKMPLGSVMITFDDGYYDNYLNVFPLLKAYNIKATIFLNTAYIKDKVENRSSTIIQSSPKANQEAINNFYKTGSAASDQYLSWEEIKEMYKSGLCDFQAHTHTHKVAFINYKLRKIIEGNNYGREEIGLFEGNVEEGLPVFYSRGETSETKVRLKERFISDFRKYYFENICRLKSKEEKLIRANGFIKKYDHEIGETESEKERELRIRNEIRLNIDNIESHLKNKVFAFAWPYGHHKSGMELIKKENIAAFLICKKGTNDRRMNFDKIKRIELRNPSFNKFRWVLKANSNLLLGKIYGLLT